MSKVIITIKNVDSNENIQSKLDYIKKLINIESSSTYIQIGNDISAKIEKE